MKATVDRRVLNRGLGKVALPTGRQSWEILKHVLVEADQSGDLWLTRTLLDYAVSVRVSAEVEEEGAFSAPHKLLKGIVSKAKTKTVEVSQADDKHFAIKVDTESYLFEGHYSRDFPQEIFRCTDEKGWSISGEHLLELSYRTRYAVSTEEARPILNGVYLHTKGKTIRAVATDGYKLAVRAIQNGKLPEFGHILPTAVLRPLEKLIRPEDVVEVRTHENRIYFSTDDVLIFARTIEGPYPRYEQVIPNEHEHSAVIPTAQFLQLAEQLLPLAARDKYCRTKFTFQPNELLVSVDPMNERRIPIEYDGDEFRIDFNCSHLVNILKHIPSERIQLGMTSPERGARFDAVGVDYSCMLMPLKIM